MNRRQDIAIDRENSLLESIEGATGDKMQRGHAEEARYGFAARLANATPPINETYRQALRAHVLVEGTNRIRQQVWTQTATGHARLLTLGKLLRAGGLAAALVLVLALVVAPRLRRLGPGTEAHPPAGGMAQQVASADVEMLVAALNREPIARTVVVYPAAYASTLAERTHHQVVPLSLDESAPLAAIQAALETSLPTSGLVDVVVADPRAANARAVRIATEQRLYHLHGPGGPVRETYGALERSGFVAGPADVELDPIGAAFEGGVELVAGGLLDEPQPGEPLRMAFDWRVTEPVTDSLATFVHLVYDGGPLFAQRDAVPGNGLFPVESWDPGQVVRDPFALYLPTDLPAGTYELRVGVYSVTSGRRYSLIEPEGGTYVVVRQWTIEAASKAANGTKHPSESQSRRVADPVRAYETRFKQKGCLCLGIV